LRKVGDPQNFARIARALAALNQRSLADFEAMMAQIGLASDLHKRGALTVYETEQAMRNDARDWELRRSLGVRWRQVEQPELRTLEPGLAPVFTHAVMLEDWAHVNDPKRIVDALRAKVRSLGASFVTGEAKRLEQSAPGQASVALVQGPRLSADRVLVCAGAWSAGLARSIGDTVLLESERGYNSTLPLCATRLNREVIFAERKFVATPLAVGLRIGGAAEFAGLTAPANFKRSGALLALARRYIPDLDERGATQWMGHRPTTPDSLPVIGVSPRAPNVLYAFGHGHLGLTQSATTAALVGELLDERAPSIDLEPYSIGRFGPSTMRTAGTTSALPT
jgi:D-amino-acid dehydrogenase